MPRSMSTTILTLIPKVLNPSTMSGDLSGRCDAERTMSKKVGIPAIPRLLRFSVAQCGQKNSQDLEIYEIYENIRYI
jgi:hypothetical protein